MRFARVIVGVEFGAASAAASAACRAARALAPDAALVLVHCVVPPDASARVAADRAVADVDVAAARLRMLCAALAPATVRAEVRVGDPADCIAALASEVGADLVVVGPQSGSPAARRRGGTAERLLARSAAPVLVATGDLREGARRLLVPVTGDDVSAAVLESARDLEAAGPVKLAVVHVERGAARFGGAGAAAATPARWPRLADLCGDGGFYVDVVAGPLADVVRQQAERFATDLVVLDGVAATRLPAAEMATLLRTAPCAVLVTRRASPRRRPERVVAQRWHDVADRTPIRHAYRHAARASLRAVARPSSRPASGVAPTGPHP